MNDNKIIEKSAKIFIEEIGKVIGNVTHIIDKQVEEDIYESNGKNIIYYRQNRIEVKKLTPAEKLYYGWENIEGSVWKNVDSLETLLKMYGRDGIEIECIEKKSDYNNHFGYNDWKHVINGFDEYYTRWANILIKDENDFEKLKDVYQIYSPVYCHVFLYMVSYNSGHERDLLDEMRKSKVERFSMSYDLFNSMYLENKILGLEALFQYPVSEEDLLKLDKRISKGESIKDLYEIVKIYPYMTIEECVKGNEKFKNKYINIKDKLEYLNEDELLEEVPFDDMTINDVIINKQYDLEYEELLNTDEIEQDYEQSFKEGKKVYILHRIRERNPKLVKESKAFFKKNNNGRLFCQVCGFDFEKIYGQMGNGFIEAHHEKPIAGMEEGATTRIEDMKIVCSNCHKMLHRKSLITIEELKLIILKER